MYRSSYSSFFLGANSPSGFYSLFDELYSPEDGWLLYILKGGPGSGKSTFMKKAAAEADRRGLYYERIFCSSDPESLDAVIFPHLKISICDGTPPHTVEPRYPGVSEVIVDLGECRDDIKLRKNAELIIKQTKDCSCLHKRATDFFAAAAAVKNCTDKIIYSSLCMDKLKKFSDKLSSSLLKGTSSVKGRVNRRFLSAYTSAGLVVFTDTFNDMCEKRIVLQDNFGLASSAILKLTALNAVKKGFDCIVCPDPMCPGSGTEHLIIPELSLGFFTSSRKFAYTGTAEKTVDCIRFSDTEILDASKNRILFNRRSYNELINEGINRLKDAKAVHDRLEKLYYPSMDFSLVRIKEEKVIKNIFQ